MLPPELKASYQRFLPAVAAVVGILLVTAALLALDPDNPSRLELFVGRLHPLFVHLPIGFLILAALLEGLSRVRRFEQVRHAMPFVLVVSAASAVAAVVAGYHLAVSGGYDGLTVTWHKRLGIGVAVGSVAISALWYAASVNRAPGLRRAYEGGLVATLLLLMGASHLGGTLTHGPDYLTEYMPEPLRSAMHLLPGVRIPEPAYTRADEARVYEHLVRPVLQARCVSCHGPDKQKGRLRLDTPEAIRKGGESGPVLVAGKSSDSEIIRRVWLPEGHEEAMPPRGRKPLTIAEGELLRWWIDQGASFDQTVAEVNPPASVQALLEQVAGPMDQQRPAILREKIAAADPAAVDKARSLGVSIKPLSDSTAFLQADCINARGGCAGAQLQALLPLAQQITVLDLRGTGIGDTDLAVIGQLGNLTRLHLERTRITDAGLAHLDSLEHLEYLNLYGTGITDAGLQHLARLKNLRSLYLWQTAVTPRGADRLKQHLGRVKINLGSGQAAMELPPPPAK